MKILYGVQGTGHGHISRAKVILPRLKEIADVDVLISGYNFKLDLDDPITYRARGVSLAYDHRGAVDMLETALKIKPFQLFRDIQKIPVDKYDFIVNDYEPVTAWAASLSGQRCVAISHQASFLSENSPRPKQTSMLAEGILKHFAPSTDAVASHYRRYDHFIEPPIIRKHIRNLNPLPGDHVTVYLPAFRDQLLCDYFNQVPSIRWEIFSPSCESPYHKSNVLVRPVGKDSFLKSIEYCLGIVSACGFETTSEAMYLGKKLLAIPIKNQYEQLCNAAALKQLGGEIVYEPGKDFTNVLKRWLRDGIALNLPEMSDEDDLISKIIRAGTGTSVAA